ncbi:hypothetical protein FIBSPDRAFT_903441 [Athelia psychrophila]|uniref:Uncharacterized protein n=1 Tax=Athelia psychrophila TaxID=1759441 RepID=A0A167W0G0_9AGAM|nr:hypothetical protein FIBSPDRAFT_903441 [Fibularhizoctonia sp. CBS 109695]
MSVCEEAPLMEGLVVGSVKNVGDAICISAEGHESWLYRLDNSNSSGGFWGNVKGSFLKEVSAVWVSSLSLKARLPVCFRGIGKRGCHSSQDAIVLAIAYIHSLLLESTLTIHGSIFIRSVVVILRLCCNYRLKFQHEDGWRHIKRTQGLRGIRGLGRWYKLKRLTGQQEVPFHPTGYTLQHYYCFIHLISSNSPHSEMSNSPTTGTPRHNTQAGKSKQKPGSTKKRKMGDKNELDRI